MKAIVTGGAGFIGSHLVDALVERGDDVVVIDDLSRGRREQVNPAVTFVQMDVAAPAAVGIVSDVGPDIIFHEAAQIDVRRSVREPLVDTTINVLGTVNLLQAAASASVPRFVFASSGGALYGDTDQLPTPETHVAKPESIYGAAKLCGEAYGEVFSRLYPLEFLSLRYANVYGPRQDPHGEAGVVAIFAQRLLRGEGCVINGPGTQTRDYVHVRDVVSANLAAITAAPGAYNIGTARQADVNDVYALVAKACNSDLAARHGPAKPGEQQRSCLDATLAQRELGWRPAVTLEEGIPDTVNFFRPTAE